MDIMWPISRSQFHVSFIFMEIKFIHFHSSVMFVFKSTSICNS